MATEPSSKGPDRSPGPADDGSAADAELRREQGERTRRRREGAIIVGALLAVLAFALWEIRRPGANDSAAGNVFSFLLVNLNIILLLLLVFLVLRNLIKLFFERRRRVPGSHLRTRTVLAFVAVALFPATLMLLISLEFITNTIDGWFGTEVDSSLRGAWQLAQTYYADSADDALMHSRVLSEELAGRPHAELAGSPDVAATVSEYQTRYRLGTIQIVDREGRQLLARFNRDAPTGMPMRADAELVAEAVQGDSATRVESLGSSDIVRGATPIRDAGGDLVVAVVIVDKLVEQSARLWSQEIIDSFREYRRLALNKRPFKNLYVLTMVLASLVVVFSATWLGLYLARGITEPLGRLSDATRQVADGNWDVALEESGGDEVGTLVRSFNSMTAQLKTSHDALDERRRYIENILGHIDAGVVSVDQNGFVSTVNPAAVSLLGLRDERPVGRAARELFEAAGYPEIVALVDEVGSGVRPSGMHRNVSREDEGRTVQVTATRLVLSSGAAAGLVVFIADVSQLVEAQRMEAWKEVARRIAHEIKNPLTPIQLSAQRMQRRLHGRLAGEDRELFDDCTQTIVKEVDGLKQLVNEFSQFARRSSEPKTAHDLNTVVEETLPLFTQSRPDIRIAFESGEDLPSIVMNRDGVKRALMNLLDNAVAAVAAVSTSGEAGADGAAADVTVRTVLAPDISRVILEVADTGKGVPVEHRARVFEPYFSTKEDGTGLGLAIVASIAADHHAYVRYHDNPPRGSRFVIEFPTATDEGLA